MFPIPCEDRSIPVRFGKAVRFKPSLIEATFDGKLDERTRDFRASQFSRHPTHVLWGHFSKPDSDYNPGSRKHVVEFHHEGLESKKRSRYHCNPLPDEYLRTRLLPSVPCELSNSSSVVGAQSCSLSATTYGLAEPRPEVSRLASQFEHQEFKLNIGDHPRSRFIPKVREADPLTRASSNPLLITDDAVSIKVPLGKRALDLPRSVSSLGEPPTFTSSSTFARYSEPVRRGGKRVASKEMEFDPLYIKATNGGRMLENCPPNQRSHHFVCQQDELESRLREGRI